MSNSKKKFIFGVALPHEDYEHRKALNVIKVIEKEYNPRQLSVGRLKVWPLARFALYSRLMRPEMSKPASSTKKINPESNTHLETSNALKTMLARVRTFIERALSRRRMVKKLRAKVKSPILIISRFEDYHVKIGDRLYDYVCDPYMDELRSKSIPVVKVIIHFNPHQEKNTNIRFVNEPDLYYSLIKPIFCNYFTRRSKNKSKELEVHGLKELNSTLPEWLQINKALFIRFYENICIMRTIFRAIKPSAVLFSCYYQSIQFAANQVASETNVSSADIQHGSSTSINPMYSGWTNYPENGYHVMPDYLLMRNRIDLECIKKKFPLDSNTKPHAVYVGNLFVKRERRLYENIELDETIFQYLDKLKSYDRVVLFSLQHKTEIPDTFWDVFKQYTSRSWICLLRKHPVMSSGNLDAMLEARDLSDTDKIEWQHASALPLHLLLRYVTHHITLWSSVAMEAYEYKVPTGLMDIRGKDAFPHMLEWGYFYYCADANRLLNFIESDPSDYFSKDKSRLLDNEEGIHAFIDKLCIGVEK